MEQKISNPVNKWISKIWSVMFALVIGMAMFAIAYASAA
jgi:hypothetical protein